jgi:hypothetical protein
MTSKPIVISDRTPQSFPGLIPKPGEMLWYVVVDDGTSYKPTQLCIANSDRWSDPIDMVPVGGVTSGAGRTGAVTLTYAPSNAYTLPSAPTNPAVPQVFINGGKQTYGLDYNIIGAVLNWISPNLTLSANDTIEVYP